MNDTAPVTWRRSIFQQSGILPVAIFGIAFVIRLAAIGRYITPDELIWVFRAVNFREAILSANWAETLQAGHPGVITMWLGSLGMSIQLLINPGDQEVYRWITQLAWLTPDNMAAFQQLNHFLTAGRLAVALTNSLGIVLVFWMARKLMGELFALLVISFLVLDPFLAGLSGILHVDGLATTFVSLSLLSLALSLFGGKDDEGRRSVLVYSAVSGSMAAIAVLAKSPSLLLIPTAAILFFIGLWGNRQQPFMERFKNILVLGLIWVGSFTAVLFLFFPALWTVPLEVFQFAGSNANRHVEEALRPTYFMGTLAFDHGPLFYPIALLWRMGPVVLVGLILLVILVMRTKWREKLPKYLVFSLLLWILIFGSVITLTVKKFDRYALPIVPALALLAAVGWVVWLSKSGRASRYLLTTLLIMQSAYMLFVLPYPLSAYNLLVGGPYSAQYVMPLGWGESISRAGSRLSSEPRVELQSALSGIAPSLAPFFPGETLLTGENDYKEADYLIVTANSRQVDVEGVEQVTKELELLDVIRFGGLDQSWIYVNPQPERVEITVVDLPYPVTFGSQMQLLSQDLLVNNDEVLFSGRWDRQQNKDRYVVKLRLVDANGHEWSDLETGLLNKVYFYPENWLPDETPTVSYKLELPLTIPPGEYDVQLSLIDTVSRSQLPVTGNEGEFLGVLYDAGSITVTDLNTAVVVNDLDMIPAGDVFWLENSLQLLGLSQLPERVISGGELNFDLFWQSAKRLPEGLNIGLQIEDEESIVFPISRFDSGLWQPGMVVQEKYRLNIPANLEAGKVMLSVRPTFWDGSQVPGPRYELGEIEVQATDYLFKLPDNIPYPLHTTFEPGIHLRGFEHEENILKPGDVFDLTLIWQTDRQTEQPVTGFVHLVDEQGEIPVQVDRWPGGLPSNIWAPGQVIIDEYQMALPLEIESGTYQIVVGLYDAERGLRFYVTDGSGQPSERDFELLPVTVMVEP